MARFVKDNVYDTALDEIFRMEPVQAFIQNKSRAQHAVLKEHVCLITRINFFFNLKNPEELWPSITCIQMLSLVQENNHTFKNAM